MTMQVGMVGTDGVLIASDTLWMNTPSFTSAWAGVRQTFNSPKIRVSRERGIAISCARNMETASHVADEIISNLRDDEWENPITPIERIGATILPSARERNDAHCLIAFVRPLPRLFLFQFRPINGQWGPSCQRMETKAIAGDNINPAIFWAERYYQKLPIKRLVPLAAQLIVAASRLNLAAISGLEIVFCDASGFHRLSEESIRELESQAEKWDRDIGDMILSHEQQCTYAPDVVG